MKKRRLVITQTKLKRILRYEPETGNFYWRVKVNTRAPAGKLAGYVNPHRGYRRIRFDKFTYAAHRLAFLYMTGRVPNQVDHINRKRDDNRWANLREASTQQNRRNASLRVNNSGVTGVCWDKSRAKWMAHITIDSKHKNLGRFDTIEEAKRARHAAEKKYFGEFRAKTA